MDAERFGTLFVGLFVVANALPVVPVFVNATAAYDPKERRRVVHEAVVTGFMVGGFVTLTGPALFAAIGITLPDLRIAGGVILMIFAVYDLLFSRERRKEDAVHSERPSGAVPLGVPILVGPATLTALLVLSDAYGALLVLAVFAANTAVNYGLVRLGPTLFGDGGAVWTRAVSKVFGLLLAALAVGMIRAGVLQIVAEAS